MEDGETVCTLVGGTAFADFGIHSNAGVCDTGDPMQAVI